MYRIKKEALEFILGVSRSLYPREFIGFLRAEGDFITEVIVAPRALYGHGFASSESYLMPVDSTIIGSVHSHPSGNNRPSQQDINLFGKKGKINLIVAYPYQTINDIAAYDQAGNLTQLETA